MRKGCLYGLGCLAVFVLSPIWVPLLVQALFWAYVIVAALVRAMST